LPAQEELILLFEQFDESRIASIAQETGLHLSFRSADPVAWSDVLNNCHYVPNAYTGASIDYQLAYHSGQGGSWKDFSLLIYWDQSAVAVWPFTLSLTNTTLSLSSQGLLLAPPLIKSGLARSSKRSVTKLCMDFAHRVAQAFALRSFESCDVFDDDLGLSDWYLEAMTRGAICRVQQELFLRTSDSWEQISKNYKKRLRYTMNQAAKLWKSSILIDTAGDLDAVWNNFKGLHIQVSGRQTRSDDSWACQLDAMRSRDAFLVYLLDETDRMIGGGYFTLTHTEGLYAVGVYDRTLFDKPVGYLVQYEAIKEMIRRGIRWYKLGALPCASDIPAPTEKEISIGAFKKHFSSHAFPKFILTHPTTDHI
jgi:FemAB family protein